MRNCFYEKDQKFKKGNAKEVVKKSAAVADFLIVGIGASAGGVQALKTFFENVEADSGAAYVVILHLSPEYDSQLTEVLQSVAAIPVVRVDEKVEVVPNHVYVVSPNESLSMEGDYLVVSPVQLIEERRAPIDIFFRTLAESHRGRAVAVILSGTGANGSMGVKRVKERGGAAFVQNPREAEFSQMPRNSIATELIDEILNVAEIPARIVEYKGNFKQVVTIGEAEVKQEEQQQALREIFTQLRVRTGHDFSNYKRPTILRRLERRINVRNLAGLPEYAAYLRGNMEETQALLKDLLISVTNFFRDKDDFQYLEHEIIPRILRGKKSEDRIRVWVAGCATGEEAYSLAMIFAEQMAGLLDAPSLQIFATDIDDAAIKTAREGLYSLTDAADVSPERLRRFFSEEPDGYRVRRELREKVLFANHNLLKDPPFSYLDMITCRNLLIYFNQAAQERVLETFHFALQPASYLFLGTSESIDGASDLYTSVSLEHHVHQSRQISPRIIYPIADPPTLRYDQPFPALTAAQQKPTQLQRISYGDLHQKLIEQYAPPSIVVNERYDIVHVSPQAGRYLQISGEPSQNLFALLRPELRVEVSTAVYQAVRHQMNVVAENLKLQIDERVEIVNANIRPVFQQSDDTARGFILIVFEPVEKTSNVAEEVYTTNEPISLQLEEELMRSQAQFRTALEQSEIQAEELKASNEELQAMNEELRSATEELETGKEEVQSVNEELVTVNQELKIKIEELSQSNNDLQNLISSTRIGTIFLDRGFRIKLFTPTTRELFNLIPLDIGRLLSDITHKLAYENLLADVETVLNDLQPIEREVLTTEGDIYLMQITPYRTAEDQISGTIITFVNISKSKQQDNELHKSYLHLKLANDAMKAGWGYSDFQTGEAKWDERGKQVIGFADDAESQTTRGWLDRIHPEDLPKVEAHIAECLKKDKDFDLEYRVIRADGEHRLIQDKGRFQKSADGTPLTGTNLVIDITEKHRAEEAQREADERLRLIMDSAKEYAIIFTDKSGIIQDWNSGAQNVFGYTKEEILGQHSKILFTPEDQLKGVHDQEMQTAIEKGKAEDEHWHLHKNGTRFYVSGIMQPLKGGKIEGFVKIARDMTGRITAEQIARDKEMLQKLVGAQEDERKRIARDLHDELGQKLTGLRLTLETIKKTGKLDDTVAAGIDEAQSLAKQIDDGVDFLAWELRPAALDDLGLGAALEKYVREWSRFSGIASEFRISGLHKKRLLPEIETNLYRITQEALNNIHKHANAGRAEISLEKRNNSLILIIEDDGKGFNVSSKKNRTGGIGLIGMRERATLIGGTLEIESARGKGTRIYVRVPAVFNRKE